jgi:hypothetical protein
MPLDAAGRERSGASCRVLDDRLSWDGTIAIRPRVIKYLVILLVTRRHSRFEIGLTYIFFWLTYQQLEVGIVAMLWLWRGLAEQRAAEAPYPPGPEEKRTERRICVGGGVGTDVLATALPRNVELNVP